jgi:hypothetical protein
MTYNIKIAKVNQPEGDRKFEEEKTVYEQRVEDLDVAAVIAVVNKLEERKA